MIGRSSTRVNVVVALLGGALLLLAFGARASDATPEAPLPLACTPPIKCCRICTTGKACGNACIQESKACSKGKGCACNVADVCAEDP